MIKSYPSQICYSCGSTYGNRPCGVATWSIGTCDICNKSNIPVTEPRDFGHLNINKSNKTEELS